VPAALAAVESRNAQATMASDLALVQSVIERTVGHDAVNRLVTTRCREWCACVVVVVVVVVFVVAVVDVVVCLLSVVLLLRVVVVAVRFPLSTNRTNTAHRYLGVAERFIHEADAKPITDDGRLFAQFSVMMDALGAEDRAMELDMRVLQVTHCAVVVECAKRQCCEQYMCNIL